ncbi:MAG: hypothetical protein ACI8RP_001924 [Urechidicola sp.]|jgi:hypothetical protein
MKVWEKYGSLKRNEIISDILKVIEHKIDFNIPDDYHEFLINYTGFENHIGDHYVVIWDLDELMEFNTDYEVFELVQNGLGIGSNGSSEMIVLKKDENNEFKILLIPYLDLDEKETYIEIGNSFSDLFNRLEADESWFK